MSKLEKMHAEYGYGSGKCKDCVNLIRTRYSRTYLKCIAYGLSHSEATDWRAKWDACGLCATPFDTLWPPRRPLVEVRAATEVDNEPMDGQIILEDL